MADEQDYIITADQLRELLNLIAQRPVEILQIDYCRRFLALDRWKKSSQILRVHDKLDAGVMPDTIEYNRGDIDQELFGSSKRTQRLINPLAAIEPVYSHAPHLRALSIGPRTEMELLHLYGIGFQPQNVKAVDLISSSPLIDAGDMHNLPYPDRYFHVVISGWAIAYSNRPERAMQEMIRVCKNRGLIAVGVTYEPPVVTSAPAAYEIAGNNFARAADFAKMLGDNLETIILQHEPPDEQTPGPVLLIARIKK